MTCLSHCSLKKKKKSSAACLGGGREGGSPSPARAAKGVLTFTGRGGGLDQAQNSPGARCPPARLRPHRRGQRAVSARAPSPTTGAAAPSYRPVSPFPLGPERRPGSSRPGARNSSPRAEPGKGQRADPRSPPVKGRGGPGCGSLGTEWRPARSCAGRTGCQTEPTPPRCRRAFPWASSGPGDRDAAGSFVLEPGAGEGGDRTRPGERAPGPPSPRALGPRGRGVDARAGLAPRGLTSPSSCTGRSSTARPRRPVARPAAAAAAAVQGPGRGASATAAPRAPQPPASRPACSGSGSAACPASAPNEQTLDPARPGGRAPSPGGQVAHPPRLQGGRPPIPAGVGAARAAGPVRTDPRPPPPIEPLKSASPRSRSRLSWGAVPVPPLRPRSGSAPARRNSAPCARAPRPVRPAGRGGYPSLRRGRGAERRGRVAQGWDRLGRRGEERAARGTGRRAREGRARLESGISSGRGKGSSASQACKVRGRGRNPRPGVCADPSRAPGRQVLPAGRLSPEWPLGCSRGAWPCHCCVTSLRPSGMFLAPTLHGI